MRIRIIFFIAAFFLCSYNCQNNVHKIAGSGIGTYYSIFYVGKEDPRMQKSVDSLLRHISSQFSIFDTNSLISKLNRGEKLKLPDDFVKVFTQSQIVSEKTSGAFDITISPLVNLWGFGPERENKASAQLVDSLKMSVGYQKVRIENGYLIRENDRVTLNFNAISKGYCVDQLAELLMSKGYSDFLIEVGGEIRISGEKAGQPWTIGIQVPTDKADGAYEAGYIFPIKDKCFATSGNYRSYIEENGGRYSHIIDPRTGYPEKSSLLSVTVMANDCMTADAFATAFMVLGIEKAMQVVSQEKELEVLFIYDENGDLKTLKSSGFPDNLD